MVPVLFRVGGVDVDTHVFFMCLGIAIGTAVVFVEAYLRRQLRLETLLVVAGAALGGLLGMRLSGWFYTLDFSANPTLTQAWEFGAHSVLGGLAGAYLGGVVVKKLIGYHVRTGDLFAPAVALGMAVGRIGCFLTEAPGRPTGLPFGVHAPGTVPSCPGCAAGLAMHPSFLYEIAFQLAAFVAICWLRKRLDAPGELLVLYGAAYGVFRFLVEFTRANDVVWLGLTRPQWFLLPTCALVIWRITRNWRRGRYDSLLKPTPAAPTEQLT